MNENDTVLTDVQCPQYRPELSDEVTTFEHFQADSLVDSLAIHFRQEVPIVDFQFIFEQIGILFIIVYFWNLVHSFPKFNRTFGVQLKHQIQPII
jgi:hypothetical protein